MLVLQRRKGEKIMIGEEIEIAVLGIDKDDNVSIGVKAPRTVPIFREEVYVARKRDLAKKGQGR